MAKAPISVVWASTTSNKAVLDTTAQGNGIVFESDIVSNIINEALFINSQATRNLQVMGGYYDAGQEYKNYQYCSQVAFVGGEYVLNYYMATQDNPTLAPTNATSYQQGTTDMEIPTNGSSVQSGWRKLYFGDVAYKNRENTFIENNTFNKNLNVQGTATLTNLTVNNGFIAEKEISAKAGIGTDDVIIFGDPVSKFARCGIVGYRDNGSSGYSGLTIQQIGGSQARLLSVGLSSSTTMQMKLSIYNDQYGYIAFVISTTEMKIDVRDRQYRTNSIFIDDYRTIRFQNQTTLRNAIVTTRSFAPDPVWEQDYATANYVNQKLQELFDYLDTRLATIEGKLGISSAKSRARTMDARAMINKIEVPKSKLAELFDRLDNLEGYEGVLGYSNEEERMELYKAIDNEEAIMQIVDSIKSRMEAEAKEREEQEAQQKQENSVDAENQNKE